MRGGKAAHVAGRFRAMRRLLGVRATLELAVRWALRQRLVPIRLPGLPHPLWMRRDGSDRFVFREMFLERELDLPYPRPVRTILDGGAYVGYSTVFLAMRHPGARVLAVEPDPDNFALLRANTEGLANVIAVQAALWDESRPVALENPDDESWSRRVTEQGSDPRAVPGISVPDLLRRHGFDKVDLLKLDVEGAEERLLAPGCESWLRGVDVAVIEAHGAGADAAIDRVAQTLGLRRTHSVEKHVLFRGD
jgi:FkbM family methyltransferase